MNRTTEIHIFEHQAVDDPRDTNDSTRKGYREQPVHVHVRYVRKQNLAYVAIHPATDTGRALLAPLLPVGAPEGCNSVHVEAVISGRLKELGAHRASQLAEYVVEHVATVCNPDDTPRPAAGYMPRYDFPQTMAPSFLRSCAIQSCGVQAEVPEDPMAVGRL